MDLGAALGLALLPGFGNMTGGLIGEFVQLSGRQINQALHTATGIVLSVVSVELMPTALERAPKPSPGTSGSAAAARLLAHFDKHGRVS